VEHVLQQNTTANGVFGAVVMWSYFERMLQLLQDIPAYKNLNGAQLLTLLSPAEIRLDAPPEPVGASNFVGDSI
jgi:hypothetical protein